MMCRIPIQRLRRSVRSLTAPPNEPAPPLPETDPTELAQEILHAGKSQIDNSQTHCTHPPSPESLDDLFDLPLESTSFLHLERMLKADPDRALARWEQLKRSARNALENGSRAGLALEFLGASPGERAEFLALRSLLRESWPPQNSGQSLLLDEMAQYLFLRQKWIAIVAMHSREPALPGRRIRSHKEPRCSTSVEATAEAIHMSERLQRLFLNALRLFLNSHRSRKSLPRSDWYQSLLTAQKASS
jgi:hypothetical protein